MKCANLQSNDIINFYMDFNDVAEVIYVYKGSNVSKWVRHDWAMKELINHLMKWKTLEEYAAMKISLPTFPHKSTEKMPEQESGMRPRDFSE